MAVLFVILKVLGWILLLILALAVLLLFLPLAVWVRVEEGEVRLWAGALFLRVPVYPWPFPPRKKKPKPPKAEKSPAKEKPPAPKRRFTLETVWQLAQTADETARRIFRGLHIRRVRLIWPVRGQDAADTALLYGRMNALLAGTLALLHNWLDFREEEIRLEADFAGENPVAEHFSCKIEGQLFIMIAAALYLFRKLRANRII